MRRKRRRKRQRLSRFQAGVIGIVLLILLAYGAYTKFANPFASKFTVHALFSSANGLNPDSLVRIAGVNVGRVSAVSTVPGCTRNGTQTSQCQAANVTMVIDPQGLPLHQDATFAIRPRIFLEGNFFVDVDPGSPSAPSVKNGHTFPITQGTEPVQFDQVLDSLQGNTRQNLQLLLKGYGTAVSKGGSAYNASIQYWLPAYEYSAIVAHDALGLQPHDLSNWISAQGTVAGALDAHPQELESLITDFNTTANAFARQNVALSNAVGELPKTLAAATPAFNALNAAFPPLERLSTALIPGVKSSGPTIDASLPFIHQLRLLVQPSELRGLASNLSVTVPALAKLTEETIPFMGNQVRPASSCVANVIYPWSQLTLNDGHFTAKNGFPPHKVYVEGVDYLPGLAGESRDFDGNGLYIRVLGALGNTVTTSLQPGLVGGALQPIEGEEPAVPPGGHNPPLQPNVPCETQAPITNLNATTTAPPKQMSVDPGAPEVRAAQDARSLLTGAEDQSIKHGESALKVPGLKSIEFKSSPAGGTR
jgi:phospholipid/cholesterol/gamma-HCH transport system substrate-binding protein